jgi:hypothetical protein
MYLFGIIGVAVVLGFYEYVVKSNLPAAQVGGPPAPTGPAFTATGKIKVGDIVTVAMVSIEPNITSEGGNGVQSETVLMTPNTAAQGTPLPNFTPAENAAMDALEDAASSGGTIDLLVTATGIAADGTGAAPAGVPLSIGVMQTPGISARVPAVFLNASVQRIVRDGKVVS